MARGYPFEVRLARDLDAVPYRTRHRTTIRAHPKHPIAGLAVVPAGGEVEGLPDPLYHQGFALDPYLPKRVHMEITERNPTCHQRAREGAKQSAASRRDHVVEDGIAGFYVFGRCTIVLGHLPVQEEYNSSWTGRYARRVLPSTGSILTRET